MNKYRLKKDLPFAKAGVEIEIGCNNNYDELINSRKDKKPAIYLKGQVSLQNLLNDGWVEEIKPREWYIGVCDTYESLHDDYESAKKWGQTIKSQNQEIIKVREVSNE